MRIDWITRATALGALLALGAGVTVGSSRTAETTGTTGATGTTTYVRTYAGTDFRSLDWRQSVQLAPNTGGGVYLINHDDSLPDDNWLELTLDLPAAAKLTRVDIYYRACGYFSNWNATVHLGSYSPSTASYRADRTKTTPNSVDCNANRTLTFTGTPIATMSANGRYAIDIDVSYPQPAGQIVGLIQGARVRYTCDATCR